MAMVFDALPLSSLIIIILIITELIIKLGSLQQEERALSSGHGGALDASRESSALLGAVTG